MSRRTGQALAFAPLALILAFAVAGCQSLRKAPPGPATPSPPPLLVLPKARPPSPPPAPAAPTPRSCVPKTVGAPPRYPDSDAALRNSPGAADRYQLLAAGRILRQQRLDELERVVAGCR